MSGASFKHLIKSLSHVHKLKSLLEADPAAEQTVHQLLDDKGSTLLYRAAEAGHAESIAELLQRGAAVDARLRDGKTALHEACNHGHLLAAEVLIQHHGTVNVHKTNGWTPLMYAASGGYLDIVKLLLCACPNRTAVLNERNREGATALYLACREGHEVVVELLAAGADLSLPILSRRSPLHVAVAGGHVGIVTRLLVAGADMSLADKLGTTLWHEAAAHGQVTMIDLLLERGLALDTIARDGPRGQHPIHAAALHGHGDFIMTLFERGCCRDPNVADSDGYAALYYACAHGRMKAVRALLSCGADPNFQGAGARRSCLHCAVGRGHLAAAKALCEAGADVNVVDCEGKTPLDLARLKTRDDLEDLLALQGAQPRGDKLTQHVC